MICHNFLRFFHFMKALGFFQHSSSCQRPHVRPSNYSGLLAGQVTSLRQQTKLLEVNSLVAARWWVRISGKLMDHVARGPMGRCVVNWSFFEGISKLQMGRMNDVWMGLYNCLLLTWRSPCHAACFSCQDWFDGRALVQSKSKRSAQALLSGNSCGAFQGLGQYFMIPPGFSGT